MGPLETKVPFPELADPATQRDLGEVIPDGLKRYPCHITAHAPVQAVQELKTEHGFTGHDVAGVTIAGSERVMRQHNIPDP